MGLVEAALWGMAGGACVELLELRARAYCTADWSWRQPIPQGMAFFLIALVIRIGVGGVLAAASAGSGQVAGPLGALGLGVAAPFVIEKIMRTVPITGTLDGGPPELPVDAGQAGIDADQAGTAEPVGAQPERESGAEHAR